MRVAQTVTLEGRKQANSGTCGGGQRGNPSPSLKPLPKLKNKEDDIGVRPAGEGHRDAGLEKREALRVLVAACSFKAWGRKETMASSEEHDRPQKGNAIAREDRNRSSSQTQPCSSNIEREVLCCKRGQKQVGRSPNEP